MSGRFVFSPSNLAQFNTCPLRFYAQSIDKSMPWQGTAQKSRGTVMHTAMEKAIRLGWDSSCRSFDEKVDTGYARQVVERMREYVNDGYRLYVEKELAVTRKGKGVDFWDEQAFMRCRADVLLVSEDNRPIIIGDIKTGRNYGDDFQLRMESLIAHLYYGKPFVQFEYWYIDQGETEDGLLNLAENMAPVADIYDSLKEASLAIRNGDFPVRRNRFCHWCSWDKTENCNAVG